MVPIDRQDDKEMLLKVMPMLDKLLECASNKNYLGRLMVSKAVFPFLQLKEVPLRACEFLKKIGTIEIAKK